jgi:eukaryotic-like serine/threonine-protein kinase
MSESRTCPNCGEIRPAHSPEGLCPRCLLQKGLDSDPPGPARGSNDHTIDLPAKPASVLDSIGATIGSVPRVLLRDTAVGETPSPIIRPTNGNENSTRYRIDGEIARGGMGSILKGRDPDLGRDVAIKVLREDLRDNDELVRRFVEEAQIGGQLQHPGVVPIYELGTFADQRPFFSMKLVKGQTLADLLAARPTPADDLPRFLSIFSAISQTMAYSHTRGVIHRDLKPSNVMVGSFGEVQVMDWGLAKVLARGGIVDDARAGKEKPPETLIATARSGSDLELSHAGSILGTPSYMAPEQARGEIDRVNERADVFALGSILCEILTGSPVFTGRNSGEIVRKSSRGDTANALARLDGCGAEAELIALAKDCLQVEPEDRPRDANVVSERITAYLAGVQERLRSAELNRVAAQGRARLVVALASSLLLIVVLGGGGWSWIRNKQSAREAVTAREVDKALQSATIAWGRARSASPGDLVPWTEALGAAKRAEALVASGDADAATIGRVQALLQPLSSEHEQAVAIERSGRLRARLDEIQATVSGELDRKQADADYLAAFREAGLDVDGLNPAEVGARIAARPDAVALAASLDHMAFNRRWLEVRVEADYRRLVEIAKIADPDPWRNRLRDAMVKDDLPAFQRLAAEADPEQLPPETVMRLAYVMNDVAGDHSAGVTLLRPVQRRRPDDFWVNWDLANYLRWSSPPRLDEALRYYTAAVALRPKSGVARFNLALALSDKGDFEAAIAAAREAIRLQPDYAGGYTGLAYALDHAGRRAEAIAALNEGTKIRAKDQFSRAVVFVDLGYLLRDDRQIDQAIAAFKEAIRIKPERDGSYDALGETLLQAGRLDEAIATYKEAIRMKPVLMRFYEQLAIVASRRPERFDEVLGILREAARRAPESASVHAHVSFALRKMGRFDESVSEAETAVRLRPDYSRAHQTLAWARLGRGDWDGAISAYREAIRLGPENVVVRKAAYKELALALKAKGLLDDAIASYKDATRLTPEDAETHVELGFSLKALGKTDEAVAAFREAIRLKPDRDESYYALGETFFQAGRLDEAIATYKEAIRLKPALMSYYELLASVASRRPERLDEVLDILREAARRAPESPFVHVHVAHALRKLGRIDESVSEAETAIRLRPDYSWAHQTLGWARLGRGDLDGAISAYREAIRLGPENVGVRVVAYRELALALKAKGLLDQAITAYKETVRLLPEDAGAHYDLGIFLSAQGKSDEAVAAYREAIRLKPDHAEAHCNLGGVLRTQGDYAGSLAMYRRGHELGSKRPDWRYPSAQWVAATERVVALADRLPAVARGDDRPGDIADRLTLAQMCYDTKRFAAAARLWAEALEADPKLRDDRQFQHRYNAACAASLGAAGQGKDDPTPDDVAKTKLRGQALDWLKAELATWTKLLESGPPQARPFIVQTLGHWKVDADLAALRDAEGLAKLSEPERTEWQAIWAEVDSLLTRAAKP